MTTREMLEQALRLGPQQRFELAEKILQSLDQPDPAIDAVWIDEAERRLAAHRSGKVQGTPAEEVFGKL